MAVLRIPAAPHGMTAWLIVNARIMTMTKAGFAPSRTVAFLRELFIFMRAGAHRGRKIMAII
jgi:hypothetical protein